MSELENPVPYGLSDRIYEIDGKKYKQRAYVSKDTIELQNVEDEDDKILRNVRELTNNDGVEKEED